MILPWNSLPALSLILQTPVSDKVFVQLVPSTGRHPESCTATACPGGVNSRVRIQDLRKSATRRTSRGCLRLRSLHKHFQKENRQPLALLAALLVQISVQEEKTGPAAQVYKGDARHLDLRDRSVDLVITSPPYLNAIDYLRCSKFSLVWMGYSVGELRLEPRRHPTGRDRF